MIKVSSLQSLIKAALIFSVNIVLLAACGGGGGSGQTGPVASTLSFPLQAGYRALTANGSSNNFTISGTCNGSGTRTVGAANTTTTFEGLPALSAASTLTLRFVDCTPSSVASTSTNYYDANLIPRGFSSVGVNYGVYLTAPTIPSTVMVGNTGIIGTETLYTNSTKSIRNGIITSSYVVEPDTANTAIINLVGRIYNSSGTLTST